MPFPSIYNASSRETGKFRKTKTTIRRSDWVTMNAVAFSPSVAISADDSEPEDESKSNGWMKSKINRFFHTKRAPPAPEGELERESNSNEDLSDKKLTTNYDNNWTSNDAQCVNSADSPLDTQTDGKPITQSADKPQIVIATDKQVK